MLCVRPNGDFVVVELKRGRASDRVVGQISRYIGWVKENVAKRHEVFGLILAADGDEAMRYAVAAHPNLRARYMVIKLELTDEPPK
jgi:RecB family endonuclease NucS